MIFFLLHLSNFLNSWPWDSSVSGNISYRMLCKSRRGLQRDVPMHVDSEQRFEWRNYLPVACTLVVNSSNMLAWTRSWLLQGLPYMWPKHIDDWRWSKGFEAFMLLSMTGIWKTRMVAKCRRPIASKKLDCHKQCSFLSTHGAQFTGNLLSTLVKLRRGSRCKHGHQSTWWHM